MASKPYLLVLAANHLAPYTEWASEWFTKLIATLEIWAFLLYIWQYIQEGALWDNTCTVARLRITIHPPHALPITNLLT